MHFRLMYECYLNKLRLCQHNSRNRPIHMHFFSLRNTILFSSMDTCTRLRSLENEIRAQFQNLLTKYSKTQ